MVQKREGRGDREREREKKGGVLNRSERMETIGKGEGMEGVIGRKWKGKVIEISKERGREG